MWAFCPGSDHLGMARLLVVEFTKMNGAGNDFVVLDNRFYCFASAELAALARDLCRRTERIGADGLLALDPGDDGADFRMLYYNADGSRATMCGNGARCLARFARTAGLGTPGAPLVFDTDAGRLTADVPDDTAADVCLHLPPPRDLRPLALGGLDATYVWTGTEHVVRFVRHVDGLDLHTLGPAIRHDPALGAPGANVNFVEVDGDGLRVRTFEKGVEAETRACGTGAMAAALAAYHAGRVPGAPVRVAMPGGTLTVGFQWAPGSPAEAVEGLTLAGPAEATFRGTVEVDAKALLGA